MTSFTLNKQLPWSVYTIVSPRNGTGSPSRRTSPTSSGFGASPRQSVEPSCLTSRTCTPGHASNARPAAGAAPSAPSPRPTSRGTTSSRVHFPRGANDASVGQHSGGASPIEGTPKAAPIHAPTESRETRRTGAAIPKLYGVPNRSIGGAGSTYAPNAFYPRERIPIHPLHNTLGRAAGAGGGEMEQSASSSAQPEDYELAEVAVAAEVAPTMMHARAPESAPEQSSPRRARKSRTKAAWQNPIQPPGIRAVHPIREISPRLASSIAAAVMMHKPMQMPEPHAPLLPRVTPLHTLQL